MLTRRQFIAFAAGTGVLAIVPGSVRSRRAAAVALPGGDTGLDPRAIPKYVTDLVQPPVVPRRAITVAGVHLYDIGARPVAQQMLPPRLPRTPIWAYGPADDAVAFTTPAATIVATADVPVRVRCRNQLVDASGRFVPHLLPVDPSLHWANPAGPPDSRPSFSSTPGSYRGPVPLVTHVHGAHTSPDSDGDPESWVLPDALDIPAGYARRGSRFDQFDRTSTVAGSAVFHYDNDQRATLLWYHDHTLGLTRLNVYAGLAGLFIVQGGPHDIGTGGRLPTGAQDLALAIQDRSFQADGALFYPDTRAFFDGGTALDYLPTNGSSLSPIWNPEFFANTMTVNGHTWPRATLEARRHRLRLLNGCNSRFLLLKLTRTDPLTLASDQPTPGDVALHLIGGDGGLAPGTEEWQIHNFTMDAHPIHVHLVTFEVIDRQRLEVGPDGMPHPRTVPGTSRPPDAWEAGRKDMVVAYPGEVTRLKATYDYPGRYTWHCHIVEHEDKRDDAPVRRHGGAVGRPR